MHKPTIFKDGEGWVLEIGGQEWDCTTWRTAMFAARYYRNDPLDPFWDRGDRSDRDLEDERSRGFDPNRGRIAGGDVIRR